jgi:hypothetical protein
MLPVKSPPSSTYDESSLIATILRHLSFPEKLRAANIWGGKDAPHRATFPGKSNGML